MSGQLPNIVGVTFGTIQMVLYAIYRKSKPVKDRKLPEHKGDINDENVVSAMTNDNQDVNVIPRTVDIEIGEEKEEKQVHQEPEKKQEQVANARDQTEDNNNKTREEAFQLQQQKEG